MSEAQASTHTSRSLAKMTIVSRQLSSFIRKRPTKQGAQKLAQFAKDCDQSFAETLLSAATKYFKQAFSNWSRYQAQLDEPVTTFMKYSLYKIQRVGLPFLLEEFGSLKRMYQKVTKRKVPELCADDIKKIDNQKGADELAHLYLKNKQKQLQMNLQQQNTKDSIIAQTQQQGQKNQSIVFNPDPLICSDHSDIQHWKEIFFKIDLLRSKQYHQFCGMRMKGNKNDRSSKLYEKYADIDAKTTNNRDCACCLRFCSADEDLAFPTYKQAVSFFGPLSKPKEMQMQITQHIVSYLNSSGGAIFIGCRKGPRQQVYPNIQVTSQKSKEAIETRLIAFIGLIYPSVAPKRQIDFSFIPVKDASKWLKGVYVLRITVYPTEPHYTYFFTSSISSTGSPHFACQTHIGACKIIGEDVYHFMTQRFHQYNPHKNIKLPYLKQKSYKMPTMIIHSSACWTPQKGDQLYIAEDENYAKDALAEQQSRGNGHAHINPLVKPGFKFITLLVASKQILEDINKIFNQNQKCEAIIEMAFPNKKYPLSNSTWLIWHNVKFDKLATGIKKEGNKLKTKNSKNVPILISTLNTILIQMNRSLTVPQVQQLKKVAFENANEKVEHRVVEGKEYFKCPSTITAVLLYFHQTSRKQKSAKFCKIPNGINSAKKEEKHEEQQYKPQNQENYSQKTHYIVPQTTSPMYQQPQPLPFPQVIFRIYGQNGEYYQYFNNNYVRITSTDQRYWERMITPQEYQYIQDYSQQTQDNYQQY